MPRELAVATERPDASVPVAAVDATSAGEPVPAVVVAEAEDEFERELIAAFGPVERWWVGKLPGLGAVRLPLP